MDPKYTLDFIENSQINSFLDCFALNVKESGKHVYECRMNGCKSKGLESKSNAIRHFRLTHQSAYDIVQVNKLKVAELKKNISWTCRGTSGES